MTCVRSSDTLSQMEVLTSREKKISGRAPSQNMQLQIAAKLLVPCCHLTNTSDDGDSAVYKIIPRLHDQAGSTSWLYVSWTSQLDDRSMFVQSCKGGITLFLVSLAGYNNSQTSGGILAIDALLSDDVEL